MSDARTKRILVSGLLAAVLAVTALTTGCSKGAASASTESGGGTSSAKGPTVIRLPNTLSDLALIADKKGFFAEENVKIEWTGQQAHGPANIVSIVAGQNDAGVSIDTAIFDAVAKGGKLKLVASTQNSPIITWLVLDKSSVKTPEDLLGKKVAGQSSTITWYPLVKYLSDKGRDYNDIEFVTVPMPQQEQALRSGQVAAIATGEPFTSQILKNGGVRKLIDDYQVIGINKIGGWAFSQKFIDENPDAVRGFTKALQKTVAWATENDANFQEAVAIDKAAGGYSFSKDWDPTLAIDEQDVAKWAELLKKYGDPKAGGVDLSSVYTNEFNDAAK